MDRIQGRYSGEEKIRSLDLDGGRYSACEPIAHALCAAKMLFVAEQLSDPCRASEPGDCDSIGFKPGYLVHARIKHYVYSDCKRSV
ncbi:hypothetical protein WJ86_14450 [Burkholderia multivorans]|nr:hypothetical protein WJ86_14450 [Burkholderia multivorans]